MRGLRSYLFTSHVQARSPRYGGAACAPGRSPLLHWHTPCHGAAAWQTLAGGAAACGGPLPQLELHRARWPSHQHTLVAHPHHNTTGGGGGGGGGALPTRCPTAPWPPSTLRVARAAEAVARQSAAAAAAQVATCGWGGVWAWRCVALRFNKGGVPEPSGNPSPRVCVGRGGGGHDAM